MFAEFLQARLQQQAPALPADLHRRAAAWYADNNLPDEAIEHALTASDFELAASLISQVTDTVLWTRGEGNTFYRWLTALPAEMLNARPTLCLNLAWTLFNTGRWHEVETLLDDIEAAFEVVPPAMTTAELQAIRGEISTLRSELALFENQTELALTLAEQALVDLPSHNLHVRSMATQVQGYTHRLLGQVEAADKVLTKAVRLSREAGNIATAIFALFDLAEAVHWADNLQSAPSEPVAAYLSHQLQIMTVRVRMANGQPTGKMLSHLLQTAARSGWHTNRIELLILQALAFESQGDSTAAVRSLTEALGLAEPSGYIRLFVDEGAPIARLLRRLTPDQVSVQYRGKLQAAFMPAVGQQPVAAQALIDPLTERELSVLRLMATGMSNREIAAELVVAIGTVAKYSNNIFTKLNVRNRAEAVLRAKTLALI